MILLIVLELRNHEALQCCGTLQVWFGLVFMQWKVLNQIQQATYQVYKLKVLINGTYGIL